MYRNISTKDPTYLAIRMTMIFDLKTVLSALAKSTVGINMSF
jgi:hypothetical protein